MCDDEKKAAIKRFQHLPTNELRAEIAKITAEIDGIEDKREDEIEKLQDAYEKFMDEFDLKIKNLQKESNYNLMKAVFTAKGGLDERDEL